MENSEIIYTGKLFKDAFKKGRRLTSGISTLFRGNRSLLSLSEIIEIEKPRGESFSGHQDIEVSRIIGSEDRSSDFSEGFLPTKIWMQKRWTKVCELMRKGTLEEPIDVIEFGGVYFIRDGNHRVSVANRIKRDFIRAKVTVLKTPYTLSRDFTRKGLLHFKKLVELQNKTRFFSSVPYARFDIRHYKTWHILEKELTCWTPSWYERHKETYQNVPKATRNTKWYKHYDYIIKFINRGSLHYLYPGWGDADVAMEMLKLWNSFPNPDDKTLEEIYALFLNKTKRKRFFLAPFHFFAERFNALARTADDERRMFLNRSSINQIRPEFKLPADLGKKYWKRLYHELFNVHAQKMKKQLGRNPYQHELVGDWFDNVWLPKTAV